MSLRYTATQVSEQQVRFDSFMQSANMAKIGVRYIHFLMNNAGTYNEYNYIMRVLSLCAKVKGAMYHPLHTSELNGFYVDLLTFAALNAGLQELKTQNQN